ncbi:MAG: hypothetical protein ACR2ID_02110 [Chthoniobacterales bacterium]
MKNLPAKLLLVLAIATTIAYAGAAVPPINVVVTKDGKAAYKGSTTGNGTFATGKLEPGNYVVQFNSSNSAAKSGEYTIVVSAGKKKVSAEGVAGEKLMQGGVAMKVDVGAGLNITGQVVAVKAQAGDHKVKIINGKRYVWTGPETGSHMGGRWVEEGSAESRNISVSGQEALRNRQDHGDAHQEGFPGGR